MVRRNPNRAFGDEIEGAIFRPNQEEEVVADEAGDGLSGTTVYTILGHADAFDEGGYPTLYNKLNDQGVLLAQDRDLACAMIKYGTTKDATFFVRQSTNGHFVDPTSDAEVGRHNKTRLGVAELRWKQVNGKCFRGYLEFLRTKNRAHLVNAEREVF